MLENCVLMKECGKKMLGDDVKILGMREGATSTYAWRVAAGSLRSHAVDSALSARSDCTNNIDTTACGYN
jgi:hypothetical protein